jgi:DNA (cytosine-5)-methyltransferase 1
MGMNAVSLFTGAGGMDVGFRKVGVSVVWANELDSDAAKTYQKNHPNSLMREGDIKDLKSELHQFSKGTIDLVFGGPPCQGFSVAGKMDPNDERSKLIWEFLDAVKILRPKLFVMENVKALGELERWRHIRERIFNVASSIGYSVTAKVLNSADFGVPQKRERVFFIGFLNSDTGVFFHFNNEIDKQIKPRMILHNCLRRLPPAGSEGNPLTCTAKISLARSPIMRKSPYAGMLFNGLGRPLDLSNQSNTLPASMGGNKTPIIDDLLLNNPEADDWVKMYHRSLCEGKKVEVPSVPAHLRRITICEAATIQTFPTDYKFAGEKSSIYRQIGNAVPCNLAASVAKAAIGVLNKSRVTHREDGA